MGAHSAGGSGGRTRAAGDLAALELQALGLQPAADLRGVAERGAADRAVGLQDAVGAGGLSRMKRWLSVRAWTSEPPAARATSP